MGENINQILQELNDIQRVYKNNNSLHRELKEYEFLKNEQKEEARKSALAKGDIVYEEKYAQIVKMPYPSFKLAGTETPPEATTPCFKDKQKIINAMSDPKTGKNAVKFYIISLIARCVVLISLLLILIGSIIRPLFTLSMMGISAFSMSGAVLIVMHFYCRTPNLKTIQDCIEEYNEYQTLIIMREEAAKRYVNSVDTDNYREDVRKICENAKRYNEEFLIFVSECEKAAEPIRQEYVAACKSIEEEYQRKHNEIMEKINECEAYLGSVTILHRDMFGKIGAISNALAYGRADSVKEAINIVLEDERREREEAQRRSEAMERQAALERQAEEARRHNAQMEYQARLAQEEEQRRYEDQERAAEKALQGRRDAAKVRCNHCANISSCSWSVRDDFYRTGDICSSYRPNK